MFSVSNPLPPLYESSSAAPVYGTSTIAHHEFFAYGANDILQRLEKHLHDIGGVDANVKVKADHYVIEAKWLIRDDSALIADSTSEIISFPERYMRLALRVFQAPVDEGDNYDLLIISVKNMAPGVYQDFQNCFSALRSKIMDELRNSDKVDVHYQCQSGVTLDGDKRGTIVDLATQGMST